MKTHMVPAFMDITLWKEKGKDKTQKPEVRLLGLPSQSGRPEQQKLTRVPVAAVRDEGVSSVGLGILCPASLGRLLKCLHTVFSLQVCLRPHLLF